MINGHDVLLKEYESCQSHNNALGQQSWVSISILITVNFLVLAQVIPNLVLTAIPNHGWAKPVFVTLLGLLMILILWIFWRWQKRIRLLEWLYNDRMREIEEELDFAIWKNWRVRGLDLYYGKTKDKQKEKKWGSLNDKVKEMIKRLSQRYPKDRKTDKDYETMYRLPTTEGFPKFNCVFPVLITLWGITIVLEILIYCCPACHQWLLN